jgi:hypothetical protein
MYSLVLTLVSCIDYQLPMNAFYLFLNRIKVKVLLFGYCFIAVRIHDDGEVLVD